MLNTMKSWLNDEKAGTKSPELRLSITKLMVSMMMVDEHIDEYEYEAIVDFLTDYLDLSCKDSKALIKQIKIEAKETDAFNQAAQQIIDLYPREERAYILSIVWRVALVDGEVTFREEQHLNRLADLFGVSESDLSALKKEQEREFPELDERNRYEEF